MSAPPTPLSHHAIVQTRYGDPHEVLSMQEDASLPALAAREVQIRVEASSINPIDWQMIQGDRRLIARRRFPFTPFFDLAGVVTAVGRDVTGFALGDRVYADNEVHGGGGAEFANVAEGLVAPAPKGLSFAEAAAIPLAAQTALTCLDRGGVTAGSRVAVIGASGGVGHFVVQMARAAGALTVGVSSAHNLDFVMGLGANEVIDRNETSLEARFGEASFDVVIDTVGGRDQWLQARRVLRPGGRFVTISRDEDGVVTPAAIVRLVASVTARRIRGSGSRGAP